METMKNAGAIRAILSQTRNNTTTWIGHLQHETIDHFSGQTFKCPANGMLNNIQVYISLVQRPGDVQLTLHEFNDSEKNWSQSIASASVSVNINDQENWLSFTLPHISLARDKTYGFRLQTSNAMLGLGEWARSNNEPCSYGQEWNADSNNRDGVFFTWFSLAFKVEMAA